MEAPPRNAETGDPVFQLADPKHKTMDGAGRFMRKDPP
jgi:hypothetical protein